MDGTIIGMFPAEYRKLFQEAEERRKDINEIRLRVGQPVTFVEGEKEWYVNELGIWVEVVKHGVVFLREDLDKILQHICQYSLYAYNEEIKQGFLSVSGGHRIGIVGHVVMEGDEIKTIKNINALNIRIAHERKGIGEGLLPFLYEKGQFKNTLLISPPGCGKTTLLRDLIRLISNGNDYGEGLNIGLVDERSEIAGSFLGIPQNDVGMRTDVLDACPKRLGTMLLLRSMSPKVIAIDEIGSHEELEILRTASYSGVKILATIHGSGKEDVVMKYSQRDFRVDEIFERMFLLSKENGRYMVRNV